MKVLGKLYLLKLKGTIRNVFSKPSSAIFTIIMILLYGALIVMALSHPEIAMSVGNLQDVSMVILVNIGFSALMVTTMMMQKKMALFTEDDAFYLFTAPFKRSAVMQYLMVSVVVSALLFGAINLFMIVMLGSHIAFDGGFLLLVFLTQSLLYFFFLTTQYYLYLRGLENAKMKKLIRIIPLACLFLVAIIFLVVLVANDFDVTKSGMEFVAGTPFHLVPVFGWVKLILVSYVAHDFYKMLIGSVLLIGACIVIFLCMSCYRKDFVEDVMADAQAFSKRYKAIKEGKTDSFADRKVKDVQFAFQEGAKAIFSKNMLLMRKTNDFIRMQDVMFVGIYLVITLIMGLGFSFYCYMLIFWMFSMIQNSDFMRDMKNYQIYLIPDAPLKKLWYVMLPTIIKTFLVLLIAIVSAYILLQPDFKEALQYFVMLSGYAFLFLATTVLSLRILKSRNNVMMENMLRMLLMILAAIPSTGVLIYMISQNTLTIAMMNSITIYNLLINFVLSGIILYGCRNMMNGNELSSD